MHALLKTPSLNLIPLLYNSLSSKGEIVKIIPSYYTDLQGQDLWVVCFLLYRV